MAHCYTCGGDGFKDKVCPECKKDPKRLNFETMDTAAFVKSAKNVKVPDQYLGIEWNKSVLMNAHGDKKNDKIFHRYVQQLEKVHDLFAQGTLPGKSALIIAPPGYSKVTWAYSCMQMALTHGFTVGELLDTVEVKRLALLAAENIKYKLYGYIDYDEYITSEVLFISITKTYYRSDAYTVIEEIKDRRSRRGLPTFFISRYPLKALSEWDRFKHFDKIIDYNGKENPLKYPSIISYSEGLNL